MLTQQQKKLLMYIHNTLNADGVCPSFDEMREALNLKSKSGVHRIITSLEERGYIRRLPNRARAVEIIKGIAGMSSPGLTPVQRNHMSLCENTAPILSPPTLSMPKNEALEIPMLGKIAAGTPIESISTPDFFISFPMGMLGNATEHYALSIEGDSMTEIGIMDGDTVLIERGEDVRDGNVVVALIENKEATLKTLYRREGKIYLQPENEHYKTQVYKPEQVSIQGRLIGLVRKY